MYTFFSFIGMKQYRQWYEYNVMHDTPSYSTTNLWQGPQYCGLDSTKVWQLSATTKYIKLAHHWLLDSFKSSYKIYTI